MAIRKPHSTDLRQHRSATKVVRSSFRDFPFDKVVAKASRMIADGAQVYQKFTCAGCGTRLTMEEPNIFHETGTCDRCPAVTNIKQRGCNYMLYLGRRP